MSVAVGQRYVRRTPLNDEWDKVDVVALEHGKEGLPEWVLRPVDAIAGGESITEADLAAVFVLEGQPQGAAKPRLAVNTLEAFI